MPSGVKVQVLSAAPELVFKNIAYNGDVFLITKRFIQTDLNNKNSY